MVDATPTEDGQDYRIDELAREAGTTVRNVRAYQDRGLLPPPRRAGRVGLYSAAHLARLRLIGELLGRGYTLSNIGEMVGSWERGQDLSELLGLESALIGPWTDDRAAPVDAEQLSQLFGEIDDPRVVDEAVTAGLIEVVDGEMRMPNPKLLEAAAILVQHGMPLAELLVVAKSVTEATEQIATAFVGLIVRNVFEPLESPIPSSDIRRLAELVRQMRPLAKSVVDAELARAMERRIQAEMGEQFIRDQKSGRGS
ncbi:MerR family transcriptional regulator [Acidiferrimicrobium sp. IK]|uniref:MerR family transcriptional regulator n=1 Tax=Acidiferrimicrobium sp. IK TaxID=2871700 RepID=UPI0021CB0F3E|nr:MerR family transcriptional regulator [Acidiferrimicrobium sp. IK]MCU4186993.1 MerR family transcriptional regulator [Acidiferrimicrobium sp. IK]